MRFPALRAIWASLLCLSLASAPFALGKTRPLAPEHLVKIGHDVSPDLAVAQFERSYRAHHPLSKLQLVAVFAPSATPGSLLSTPLVTSDDKQPVSSFLASSNSTRAPPQFTSPSE